ncbi:zinc ribbon domain-containing protein [Rubellicoccus peritrichatus]|uniref:Zinc ribbon domain-containing protein n=1 Tax=Rubellicoccus peritrichatus TaxID=3080537 RepID=A0AAQ3QUE7_9BACT|nr:zinc ribbon domain-containing protein [Puniceicoccus sp. CR14]WOO39855.1 zinc ribbon domain-containing protein [Puniceicoccus sp. CR14]
MPTYEYHCDACERDLEIFQSMKDDALTVCPECGKKGKIHRQISGGAGIIFKGSGFYETDYKSKSEPKTSEKSESKTSETKSPKKEKTAAAAAS